MFGVPNICDTLKHHITSERTIDETGTRWTDADVVRLKTLAEGNTPTRVMDLKLKRTATAVQSKASEVGVSLKPVNQSPYNRRKP